jgi:hypothetical protein
MGNRFASGKNSIAMCDRCGQQFKLTALKKEVIKTKLFQIKVCKSCWDPDQPQLQLGMYPVSDPQAIREPRPDTSYYSSGLTGLQTESGSSTAMDESGYPADGSRQIQWSWNPVGGASQFDTVLTPNNLIAIGQVGTVTVTVN